WAFIAALAGNACLLVELNNERNANNDANERVALAKPPSASNVGATKKTKHANEIKTRKSTTRAASRPPAIAFGSIKASVTYSNKIYLVLDGTSGIKPRFLRDRMIIEPELPFTISTSWWSGYSIEGPFKPRKEYKITILKGLCGSDGAKLAENVVRRVVTGDYRVKVSFKRDGVYMASKGNMLLPLDTVNVDTLNITLRKIHSNNIVHFLRDSGRYEDLSEEMMVLKREISHRANKLKTVALDLKKLIPDKRRGIFVVSASGRSDGSGYDTSRKTVILSDLGIIAKLASDGILLWVNTISDGAAIENAEISLLTSSNQIVATGKTDSKGVCRLKKTEKWKDNAKFAVLVRKGGTPTFYAWTKESCL
ncbi:MAG: hypothetical protein GXP32_08620, partial [Kiritimatiellaeota bacterium]|nr:hypothetical protein [Kiritimatiellota bacterium]